LYSPHYYNLLERLHGTRYFFDASIGLSRGLLGAVLLVRGRRPGRFTSAEQTRLKPLIPHFAFCPRDSKNVGKAFADRGRTGLIVAERQGHIRRIIYDNKVESW
jgi:hypothetical protein